jgi:twitching motility protein PilT
VTLIQLLTEAVRQKASDVHIKVGIPPMVRVHGYLRPLYAGADIITKAFVEEICEHLLTERNKQVLLENKEVDVAYSISKLGRFRANLFQQRGSIALVIRNIPYHIPSLSELHLPKIIEKLTDLDRGLILFTGETGSGKSTSLASFVNAINKKYQKHIITIEDPIEYLVPDHKSVITQREVGVDTSGFHEALRASLRQDPDVILIGELRDAETLQTAMMAAETGHLVLSTLHTLDAKEAVLRILSYFQPHQHSQIQVQLTTCLKAIVAQRLLSKKDGSGFVPAVEVMINNSRISEYIMDISRLREITHAIEESHVSYGMQSFDQCLAILLKDGLIDETEALKAASSPNDFELKLRGIYSVSRNDLLSSHDLPVKEDNTVHKLQLETILKKDTTDSSIKLHRKKKI